MTWRRRTRVSPFLGDPTDAQGMAVMFDRYVEWMKIRNFSERTVETYDKNLRVFLGWCEERAITKPIEVTKAILERYQKWVYNYRTGDEKPLSFRSQEAWLIAVRVFFKWLSKQGHIPFNPASELELPKTEERLPVVLTAQEVEAMLNECDLEQPLGIRNRAILETFYATGIRRMELINLKLYDLDLCSGTLIVRQGKGKKDRVIPIGERAIAWIEKYISTVRPQLIKRADEGWLFLNYMGNRIGDLALLRIVRGSMQRANITKPGSCHLLRHTMATLMLEGGADIRYVQQMLGHEDINTTKLYTQVSIQKLKEVYKNSHPAAQFRRRTSNKNTEEDQ